MTAAGIGDILGDERWRPVIWEVSHLLDFER